MPLDGHSYLVSQGWGGKGTGLRQGAISRPLAIPQKKNLAGLGKDRDEAFPFWDHLFSAAAKSIQVKCLSDEEDNGDESSSNVNIGFKRTSTGILSNRRPTEGTPATSGSSTPIPELEYKPNRLSLLATAKRDAAKRGLYSKFFRGPTLGPETIVEEERRITALFSEAPLGQSSAIHSPEMTQHTEICVSGDSTVVATEDIVSLKKKRKSRVSDEGRSDDDRAARKRRKREERKRREVNGDNREKDSKVREDFPPASCDKLLQDRASNDATKSERRRHKEERKRLKKEKIQLAIQQAEDGTNHKLLSHARETSSPKTTPKLAKTIIIIQESDPEAGKKKKKRRKEEELAPS